MLWNSKWKLTEKQGKVACADNSSSDVKWNMGTGLPMLQLSRYFYLIQYLCRFRIECSLYPQSTSDPRYCTEFDR